MVTQPPKPCAQRKRFTDKRPQRTDMANMNDLHAVGLNPFGVQLVAESLLKSPLAPMTADKPVTMFFPVQRSDCAGWAGVRFTFEAVRAPCERSNDA